MPTLCIAVALALAAGPSFPGETYSPAAAPVSTPASPEQGSVTIVVELVVEDAAGRPIADLRLEEIEVVQDAERQRVKTFKALPRPGRYEVAYAPHSGKAGGVTVRVLRPGSRVRGPDGPFLKPRVLSPLPPLEEELSRVLEARPAAADLACQLAVLRFEARPTGVHHTLALEVPLSELRWSREEGRLRSRLQVLARIKGPDGHVRQRLSLDRPLEVESEAEVLVHRLVWTGNVHLPPERYTVEVLVREPGTERATTRTLTFEAPPARTGLGMSSVTLLQPAGVVSVRDEPVDDPLFVDGAPLMPTLSLVLPVGAPGQVRFFVTLYPDPKGDEPVSLRLEVYREGAHVGGVPITLPAPDASGEIRYVGAMPTRTFRNAPYTLKLVARQGEAVVAEEASFSMTAEPESLRPPLSNQD